MEFAGTIYKDVEFTLDDRRNRTRILLNRETMRRLNVIVNPQRKYVVTSEMPWHLRHESCSIVEISQLGGIH